MHLTIQERRIVFFLVGIFFINAGVHLFKSIKAEPPNEVPQGFSGTDSLFLEKVALVDSLIENQTKQSTKEEQPVEVQQMITDRESLKVDINSAKIHTLQELPRIGPVIAKRIIAHREKNGYFKSIRDLQEVKGIGPVTVSKIEPYIIIQTTTP